MKNRHGIPILPSTDSTRAREIRRLARKHGWEVAETIKNKSCVIIKKGFERMVIYYSDMTVLSYIDHPKKGRTELCRKGVSMGLLEKLFINPRLHTNTGYYS